MHSPWHKARGSITLVALSLAIVIGISLASYLALCQQSLLLSTRTVQLSKARQLAETGLEEALWSLNANANPNTTISSTAWTNASWSLTPTSADKSCTISGYDLGNGATGKIDITIINYNGPNAVILAPTIISTATVTILGMGDIKRTLTATTRPAPLFANAIGIIDGNNGRIIFNSAGLVDSWDSDYLAYAPLGPIPVPALPTPPPPNRDYSNPTSYPGTVPATLFTSPIPIPYTTSSPSTYPDLSFNYAAVIAAPYITLNSAEIRGYAMTFKNPINITTGTGGSKIMAPPPPPGTPITPPPNIDPTRVSKSAFVPSYQVAKPIPSSGTPPNLDSPYTATNLVIIGGTITNPEIRCATSDLILSASTSTIEVQGPTIIIVPGDFILTNGGKIIIDPVNGTTPDARLEIFVGGNILIGEGSSSIAGIDNQTMDPKKLALYSTGPSRSFQYQSTQHFCGVIYSAATSSRIQFLPSTPNPVIHGAILANYNIEFDSGMSPQIHYDTALQYLPKGWFKGVTTPFMITQLTETP